MAKATNARGALVARLGADVDALTRMSDHQCAVLAELLHEAPRRDRAALDAEIDARLASRHRAVRWAVRAVLLGGKRR